MELTNFYVVGGGRWARVVVGEAHKLKDQNLDITIVSTKNYKYMQRWVDKTIGIKSINVTKEFPINVISNSSIYVVNETRNRYETLKYIKKFKIPTLVEKPFMLDYSEAKKIVDLYKVAGVILASSQVFRFLDAIKVLKEEINGNNIISIECLWHDLVSEIRYEELKKYESDVPIYFDILPHIYSLVSEILGSARLTFDKFSCVKLPSDISLICKVNDVIDFEIKLSRSSSERVRLLKINTNTSTIHFDFSTSEIIKVFFKQKLIRTKNLGQSTSLQSMLRVFFEGNKSKIVDQRLDIQKSLEIIKLCQNIENEISNFNF